MQIKKSKYNIIETIPLLILLCLSGNPIFVSESYSKILLTIYTIFFSIYTLYSIGWELSRQIQKSLLGLITFIFILVIFQRFILGYVSYFGVFALVLKIVLGLFTVLYYQHKKIDFVNSYVKLIAFLSIVSIPFFILNFFIHTGFQLNNPAVKSMLFYTSFDIPKDELRNSGMFWEPGAFAGYLILALVFVALKNGKFQVGAYKKEVFWIVIGLLTTMSTTGFIVFGIILVIYSMQNYGWGRLVLLPVIGLLIYLAFFRLNFMQKKMELQFNNAMGMSKFDISNSRFGALNMDLQYIKAQPLTGNGLDVKTRFRFHPWITGDIGHGNGMSNFLAYWGIPFFLFWLYCVFKFSLNISQSKMTAWSALIVIILVLQGEQFLNFPIFLLFYSLPYLYKFELNRIKLWIK